MNKKIVSEGKLQDARGLFIDAASNFDRLGLEDDRAIPRPSMQDVTRFALSNEVVLSQGTFSGALLLRPSEKDVTSNFPGLRGVARYKTSEGIKMAPAIILRDGQNAALLTADANPYEIDALKHSLLENLYATQKPDITAHSAAGVAPTVGGHALVAASFIGNPFGAHDQVHSLGRGNFGTQFDETGSRDIVFGKAGQDRLKVRSAVLSLSQIIFEIADAYQANEGEDLLGAGMKAGDLNIAMTVAATISRYPKVDIASNMEAMAKA